MRTIAILAPPMEGISPDSYERARMAMLEQMTLLARGLPVTHPAARAAAELVGSAIAAGPSEFSLAAPVAESTPAKQVPVSRLSAEAPAAEASPEAPRAAAAATSSSSYSRYLSTILKTQPKRPAAAAAG